MLGRTKRLICGILLVCFTFGIPFQTSSVFASQGVKTVKYKVKQGDTLSGIAYRYGTTVKELIKLNGLNNDRLALDQVLVVARKKVSVSAQTAGKTSARTSGKVAHKAVTNRRAKVSRGGPGQAPVGELLAWELANKLFSEGMTATIYDVETGKTLKVKRNHGHYHADVDPATAQDTETLSALNGGSWSWDRRAIVISLGNRLVAASMNGMPHGNKLVRDNKFPGHFCVHFLGSKTHGSSYTKSGVPTVDAKHQAMVRKAAGQ